MLTLLLLPACGIKTTQQPPVYQADFRLLTRILKQAHAGLYHYRSPRQIDSVFTQYDRLITPQTDLLTFYGYVSAAVSYLGSLHDEVSLPPLLTDSLRRQAAFFPLPVRLLGDSLICDARRGIIPAGAVLHRINGVSVTRLLPRLYAYYTTDGDNLTGKQIGITNRFGWLLRLACGPQDTFLVEYRPCGQFGTRQVQLKAQSLPLVRQQTRFGPPAAALRPYQFQQIDSLKTALLTLNTFELDNAHRYARFLDSCFAQLEQQRIRRLIVDIRRNGGGDDPNDLVTFSYLAHRPFRENRSAFVRFQRVPFPAYYMESESGERAELEAELRREFTACGPGRYCQRPAYNPVWQPDKRAFRGQLYVLIGPAVASAASLFVSLVASEGQAVLVGQETMGGYYGHTGHKSVTYQLPTSGLRIHFSIVDLRQAVRPQVRQPAGRGVLPTLAVRQYCQAYLDQTDAELKAVLQLIRQQASFTNRASVFTKK